VSDRARFGIDVELAWAAGFFDGEGNVGCYKHSSYKQKTYLRLVAQIAQVDREVLDRFALAVGGGVTGPYPHKGRVNPYWRWHQEGTDEIQKIFDLLHPYLSSIKVAQFSKAIEKMGEYKAGAHGRHVAAGVKAASVHWSAAKMEVAV